MNIFSAVIAGLIGTVLFTAVLMVAPRMGMPKMDIVSLLGAMFGKANNVLGWMMHLMMGVMFALIYAFLWSRGVGSPTWSGGLIFGVAHWLVVGLIMGMIPRLHAGSRSGSVKAPGIYMSGNGSGPMAFMGGLDGHMIFGLMVALLYPVL